MDTNAINTEILSQVVSNTDSGIVLIFVIIAVALVPLGILIIKHSKHRHEVECKRRDQDRERELQIINVITANTEAMTGLRTTLDGHNKALRLTIKKIYKRLGKQGEMINAIYESDKVKAVAGAN